MAAMRVIYTGPEHRPEVVPVFVEEVDMTLREGGTEATPESGGLGHEGVGARSGADAEKLAQASRP